MQLANGQYDLPIRVDYLYGFRQIYGRLEITPFSEADLLTRTRGVLGASRTAIRAYEDQLQNGVWPGVEVWHYNQLSKYKEVEKGNVDCTWK